MGARWFVRWILAGTMIGLSGPAARSQSRGHPERRPYLRICPECGVEVAFSEDGLPRHIDADCKCGHVAVGDPLQRTVLLVGAVCDKCRWTVFEPVGKSVRRKCKGNGKHRPKTPYIYDLRRN
jgi:hypothetical protein